MLDAALRNLSTFTGLSYKECLPCITTNPARILGLEKQKGVIAPRADADLAVLDVALHPPPRLVHDDGEGLGAVGAADFDVHGL